MTDPAIRPASVAESTRAANVGLRDAGLAGWYREATGELFEGFRIGPDDVVADIGCGDGGNAAFCGRFAARVIVADVDPGRVERTVRRVREAGARHVEGIATGGDPLPIPDATASRVVCTEVLEHVPDPARFLAELARIGRPGAEYFITVPDPLGERLQLPLAAPGYFAAPNHVRVIGRDELPRLIEAAGLRVTRRAAFGFYWTIWMTMFWNCGVDLAAPSHPVLDGWSRAWDSFLDTPEGRAAQQALDAVLPKSQVVLARKPG